MYFVIISIFVVQLVILLFVIRPLFAKRIYGVVERDAINVESNAQRLKELNHRLNNEHLSQEEYEKYRLELELNTAADLTESYETNNDSGTGLRGNYWLTAVIVLFVPVSSGWVYKEIGSSNSLGELTSRPVSQSQPNVPENNAETDRILREVEKDILSKPDDIEGRITLGQVYVELGRYVDAAAIFRELYELKPTEPDFIVNFAESLGRTHGNRLEGRPKSLLDEALALEPNHGRALWLSGFAELQLNNPKAAVLRWQHLLKGLQPDTEFYSKIESLISDVASDGTPSVTGASPGPESDAEKLTDMRNVPLIASTPVHSKSIQVHVSAPPGLKASVSDNTTMFVFARAVDGPPMPLAVYKGTAKELPLTVVLDESMAMVEKMSIADFDQITITARLSTNGQPQGVKGDPEGSTGAIDLSSTPAVNVVIHTAMQ